jgi:hypothetical protein
MMRKLFLTGLLILVAGCATPYRAVSTPGEGSYYIAETPAVTSLYGSPYGYWDYGFYPWWSTAGYYGYSSYPFFYYSPNFYPHYFSVWSPGWHHNAYAWNGAWRPPYRPGHHHDPVANHDNPGERPDRPPHAVVAPVVRGSGTAYPQPIGAGQRTAFRDEPVRSGEIRVRKPAPIMPMRPTTAVNQATTNTPVTGARQPRSESRGSRRPAAGQGGNGTPHRAAAPSRRGAVSRPHFSKIDIP